VFFFLEAVFESGKYCGWLSDEDIEFY